LLHRGHADQSLKQGGLGEFALDREGQVLIQCRDGVSTTFFRLRSLPYLQVIFLLLAKGMRKRLQRIWIFRFCAGFLV
jgi:hypothetical protein